MGLFSRRTLPCDECKTAIVVIESVFESLEKRVETLQELNKKIEAENVRLNQMLGQEAQARKAAEAELNRYREAEREKNWNERITAQISEALGLPEGEDVLQAVQDLAAKVNG